MLNIILNPLLDIMGSNAYWHEANYLIRHLTLYSLKPNNLEDIH